MIAGITNSRRAGAVMAAHWFDVPMPWFPSVTVRFYNLDSVDMVSIVPDVRSFA